MTTSKSIRATFVALLVLAIPLAARPARAAEPPRHLVYATYRSEVAAMEVFRAMRAAEDQHLIRIDSYAVVSKGFDGRVRVKDQRSRGARAGVVVGALVGLVGGPVGVVVGAAAGGAVGYLTGNAVGMPRQTVDMIKSSLNNGESAVIAVVEDKYAAELQKMEEAKAARITNESIPLLKEESAP